MDIRRATPQDAAAIRAVAAAGWRDTYGGLLRSATIEAFLDGPYSIENVHDRIAAHDFLVAEDSEGILAYADAVPEAERIFLAAIYALPEQRGKGAGTALLDRIATNHPGRPIDAFVLVGNREGEAFYEHRGFVPFETVQGDLFGELVTERRWRRPVGEPAPFPEVGDWPEWKQAYRYGALVIVPPPDVARPADALRKQFDPVSAAVFGAHISLTPPFVREPSSLELRSIARVIGETPRLKLCVGPAARFPASNVVYLAVHPDDGLSALRSRLMASGLFRTDLPHANAFVPHLTISENGTNPGAAMEAARSAAWPPSPFPVTEVAWITPDEEFRFAIRDTFALMP